MFTKTVLQNNAKRQLPERGEIARDGSLKSIKGTYKARGGVGGGLG